MAKTFSSRHIQPKKKEKREKMAPLWQKSIYVQEQHS
jgi:hypothetical protein